MPVAMRVQMMTPSGPEEYIVYNDNREMAADFRAGVVAVGTEVIYRNGVYYVLSDFTDEDGASYLELVLLGGLNGSFTILQ